MLAEHSRTTSLHESIDDVSVAMASSPKSSNDRGGAGRRGDAVGIVEGGAGRPRGRGNDDKLGIMCIEEVSPLKTAAKPPHCSGVTLFTATRLTLLQYDI